MKVDKNKMDVSQVFYTFMTLMGDVEKTALALDLDPQIVLKLSEDEGWNAKLRALSRITESGTPGEFEKATNRALNYVQAHRMRAMMEQVVNQVNARMAEADWSDMIEITHKKCGLVCAKVTPRFFSEMAQAMEKMQELTYKALGDTAVERRDNPPSPNGLLGGLKLHEAVIDRLNSVTFPGPVPPDLVRVASAIIAAEDKAKQLPPPESV